MSPTTVTVTKYPDSDALNRCPTMHTNTGFNASVTEDPYKNL
ncbi:26917_t:CDS:2 [Gigaspora margarita]|uniref:26917_t:CDS:1 n=1 Tax=Gigaspora margarita TaxID=4874 RepID=A0ABN7UIM9_GIGMA|nr:26917_t:CDS:2 [Gigaspora margarita]